MKSNPPEILTTTVGSYSPIDWLAALPSEQAVLDATSVVINTQRRAGVQNTPDRWRAVSIRCQPSRHQRNDRVFYFAHGRDLDGGGADGCGGVSREAGDEFSPQAGRGGARANHRRRSRSCTKGLFAVRLRLRRAVQIHAYQPSPPCIARTLLDNHYAGTSRRSRWPSPT